MITPVVSLCVEWLNFRCNKGTDALMKKFPFYRIGCISFVCKVRDLSTLLGLCMLREQAIFFFLESRPVGRGVWWVRLHPAPLPPQAMEVHFTLRPIQVVGKQNSSIQFLPGQPHFLAHSCSFILRDWVHLSVLFVKMWLVYYMEIANECQELKKISSRG